MSTNSGNADAIRVQLNRLWPSSITPNGKTLADHYVVQAAFTALGEMEAENAKLRAALERVDGLLADPAGHPLDAINFARDEIRAVRG